jgi:aminoglycoside phosphotransferase (APT) family kinase protein
MTQPWTAEHAVSTDLARALIEEQFPHLAPAHVESFGVGWDNTAFCVNDAYVFRFPRRPIAVPLLETEASLLPVLAARLPLPVPVPAFLGRPGASFPWPFAGYALLPGRTACAADLDEDERAAAAIPLARFLAALHAVPAAEATLHGAGPDTLARLDFATRVPRAREVLAVLAQRGHVEDVRPLMAVLDRAPAGYVPRADVLVHGDLYARHLLVDGDNRPAGVIDWGDLHLGDPALDLALAHTFLPPAAHPAFRRAYGPIDDTAWLVARCRAVWHTALVLVYALEVGDADLVREAKVGLHYLCLA